MTFPLNIHKVLIAAVVAISLAVAGALSAYAVEAPDASDSDTRVADPQTMDGYTQYFSADVTSTEYAGGVWMDKSVFTNADAFESVKTVTPSQTELTMEDADGNFLVALSAIASNKSIVGHSTIPTDTCLVLDMSSSMYKSGGKYITNTVDSMVAAVNSAISQLQNLNRHNRVGVIIYFGGGDYLQSKNSSYAVLLPLDRYAQSESTFLTTTSKEVYDKGAFVGTKPIVKVNTGVTVESSGLAVDIVEHSAPNVAGTYTQLGLAKALEQMAAADTTIPSDDSFQAGATRIPIVVLMSDGEPTAATNTFASFPSDGSAAMGNNTVSIRNPAESDFVTQLTAAWVRAELDAHYEETEPLFYTLSLGSSISLDVMDPHGSDVSCAAIRQDSDASSEDKTKADINATIAGYWNDLLGDAGKAVISVGVAPGQWTKPDSDDVVALEVNKVQLSNGASFPSNDSDKYYVDKAFSAKTASDLESAFNAIVKEIEIQSKYYPTQVDGSVDFGGYLNFIDRIGEYMEVKDVKGMTLGDAFYDGSSMAAALTERGDDGSIGSLGTTENPTLLGDEIVRALKQRLRITETSTAQQLIADAYEYGQISYENASNFSNYIAWYGGADGSYLGSWDDRAEFSQPAPDGASFAIRSYGYLNPAGDDAVLQGSLAYVICDVVVDLSTGENTVLWSIPASMIPVASYDVTLEKSNLDDPGAITVAPDLTVPLRFVYEVGLQPDVKADPTALVREDYPYAAVVDLSDGGKGVEYTFYSNKWAEQEVGEAYDTYFGRGNTISYFQPNERNELYYYTVDTPIYVKNGEAYELYDGSDKPSQSGEYYSRRPVFNWSGQAEDDNGGYDATMSVVYRKIVSESLEHAKSGAGFWYIPRGTIERYTIDHAIEKASNDTGTVKWSNYPAVRLHDGHYDSSAVLGNNGKMTITVPVPFVQIEGTKTLENRDLTAGEFAFELYETESDYAISGLDAVEAKNEETGAFAFGALAYYKAGTYYYVVKESAGTQEGIAFDDTEYRVEIVVAYDEAEGLHIASQTIMTTVDGECVEVDEIAFVNEAQTIDIPVEKKWVDGENQDGKRASSVEVKLLADGVDTGKSLVLDESNNWKGSFDDLVLYGAPNARTIYTVMEESVPDGYEVSVAGSAEEGFVVTNSHTPETITVSGTKTWVDAGSQAGSRPESITVNLLADGVEVDEAVVTPDAEGVWTYSFADLPKYKDGTEIVYSVTEDPVSGYRTSVEGFDITNTFIPAPTVTFVSGTKTWDDESNQDGLRPDFITVNLYADGEKIDSQQVTADESGSWTYVFTNLPIGKVYTVAETPVEGYETIIDGFNIINKHVPDTTSISGKKVWVDQDNASGKRPDFIVVRLFANGIEVSEAVVSAETDWSYSFTNLPKNEDGIEISYTVSEVPVEGYDTTVNGFNIVNTLNGITEQEPDDSLLPDTGGPDDPEIPALGDRNTLWIVACFALASAIVTIFAAHKVRRR